MALDDIPEARPRPARRSWAYVWMLPVLAALFAGWLMLDAWRDQGRLIRLHFAQGHGIAAGDPLRYRGIEVGTVEQVSLSGNLTAVTLRLRLSPQADSLARAGSRFWIVRPQLELAGVRGLDTVVGGNYLNVLPGDGEPQSEFAGLDRPPPLEAIEPGGLEIVLAAAGKGNLKPGAPISYRQVIVGSVLTVDLAKDATAVEARAYIKPDYVNLIRREVKFWRAGGARVSAGLGGLSLAVDSVHSLILGGINLAIPPQPGPPAARNARFTLYDEPQDRWLSWTPGLSLYEDQPQAQRPQLLPGERRWRYRNWLYQTRDGVRRGWLVALPDGLLGPADVLLAPQHAQPDSARLRVDGVLFTPGTQQPSADDDHGRALARLALPEDHDFPVWQRTRRPAEPEDSLIVAGGDELTPRFVGAERFTSNNNNAANGTWPLDPALPFDPAWHGAAVVAESDGALLGLLLVDEDGVRLARLPADEEKQPTGGG